MKPGLRGEQGGLKESALGPGRPLGGKMAVCKDAGLGAGGVREAPGRAGAVHRVWGSGDSPACTDVALNPISV